MRIDSANAFVLTLWCACILTLSAQAESQQARRELASGKPLDAVIEPGERELVIESRRSAPLVVQPPAGVHAIDWLVRVSDAVLLIVIEDIEAKLTADRTWVTSLVEASVVEVLKNPGLQNVDANARVRFEQDGGEVTISGTRVRAVLPWARSLETTARYLVFATVDPATKRLVFDSSSMYEASGQSGFRSLLTTPARFDEFERASEDAVLQRIRSLHRQ